MMDEQQVQRIMDKKKMIAHASIRELTEQIHSNAVKHGWWETQRQIPELIALCHSELSEALEEFRDGHEVPIYYKEQKPEGIAIELADVIIRILDMCGGLNIDIQEAIAEKMAYNETRPYRHGNKKA